MKLLTSFTISLFAVSCLLGQVQPEVSLVVSDETFELQVVADPDDIEQWRSNNDPALFAWPVDFEMILSADTPLRMNFSPAIRVLLVVESEGNAVMEVLRDDASLMEKVMLSDGVRRLVEVRADRFQLRVGQSTTDATVRVTRAYVESGAGATSRDFGFGTSDDCHPNALCEENDPWRDQIRSAVRIMIVVEEGTGWCTGTLMNNTRRDGTPIILSAEHCLAQYTPMWDLWRFDFNYQSGDCVNPGEEPNPNSLQGCTLRAKHRDTDFLILELEEEIPVFYNAYFSGWNRKADHEPDKVALIHHPSGDIKKVSRDMHKTVVWDKEINWNEGYTTPANTHFRSRLDHGAFEGGSSGGGLFDEEGSLVGQLHGGSGDCVINNIYSGILRESWDYGSTSSSRAKDWLDPLGLDTVFVLEGMEHPALGESYGVAGEVRDPFGSPVKGISISITGGVELDIQADSTGSFTFDPLPAQDSVRWEPSKPGADPTNGVSATDLLLIKKHLLGDQPFTEAYQFLAADATGNGELSAGDILQLQKLLLGLIPQLQAQEAWIFDPPQVTTVNPQQASVELQFTAIKVGDVNGTADPGR